MNPQERIQLNKMIDANNAQNYTGDIREKKHSIPIHKDVQILLNLKQKYKKFALMDPEKFDSICVSKCPFLFNNYTDIFNKVKKDEIDLNILNQLLNVLKQIEDGNVDQHEASVLVGTLLKEIYIDSALKKAEHLDEKYAKDDNTTQPKDISWRDYKRTL